VAFLLFFLSAAFVAQICSATPFQWAFTGSLNTARHHQTATLLPDGMVLVAGGFGANPIGRAELYDPANGTWSFTGSLNVARSFHTATLLSNGLVLVAGGSNTSAVLTSAELYDPATGT
jgi:acyl-CoA reductase-like NAD-dependent aldehyde dehydrogenase